MNRYRSGARLFLLQLFRPNTGQSRLSGLTLDTEFSRQTSLLPKELEAIFTFEGVSHDLLLSDGRLSWEPITVDIPGVEAPIGEKYCVEIEKFVIGVRLRKIKTVIRGQSRSIITGFNLKVIADDEEFDFSFNNDSEELVREWASAILKIIRKRPFIAKNHAKIFVEKSDLKELPTILNYFHSAGLKYTICKLTDFKFVLPTETAILIGTEKFLQFAFEYR